MFHSSKLPYYYIILAFLLLAVAVCHWVSTSKMGYYFRAIKESHEIAQVLGVDVVRYRLYAIMISAFLTSMAGTFYAQYVLYIDPDSVMILPISVQIGGYVGRGEHCARAGRRRSRAGPALGVQPSLAGL
jgi:branched-chain amino acid transport system permease protein